MDLLMQNYVEFGIGEGNFSWYGCVLVVVEIV